MSDAPDERPIDEMLLPERYLRKLRRAGIHTLGQLAALTDDEFDALPGVGPVTRRAVTFRMADVGVRFTNHWERVVASETPWAEIAPPAAAEPARTEIVYVVGDATAPVGAGQKIIAHVCNDGGAWGAGFARALSRRWPQPEREFRRDFRESMRERGRAPSLGMVLLVSLGGGVYVANMIAQHGLIGRDNPHPLDYESLRECLAGVAMDAQDLGASVHMPRIGCGLAGGTWDRVEPLILTEVCGRGVPVTVYDLP